MSDKPPRGEEQPDDGYNTGAGGDDDVALSVYRGTRRMITGNPIMRMVWSLPGTLRFVADNLERRLAGIQDGRPDPRLSVGLAAHVAADEAVLALAMGPNRFPKRADYLRVGGELRQMHALFEKEGWLADPRGYHREPPPLIEPALAADWTLGVGKGIGRSPSWQIPTPPNPVVRFERMLFASGFEPRPGESGHDRWLSYEPNRTAGASVMRHPGRGDDHPWLVGIHGFGMGFPYMDFGAFDPQRLHRDMGYNLVLPTLPLHGHRKITRFSGEAFLSFDLVNSVHGLAQSIWDIRRVISWIRSISTAPIAVYGVSLGAYVAALLSTIEPGLDRVLAGIPVCDFPSLFESHSPRHIQLRATEHGILGGAAEAVHRVVSPLAMKPLVDKMGRFIFAGQGDRVVTPTQAHALWKHWDEPSIRWYPGGHVAYLMSREVHDYVDEVLDPRRRTTPELLDGARVVDAAGGGAASGGAA